MLVVISQETFVPLKGGWPILRPRAALARSRSSPLGQHFQTPQGGGPFCGQGRHLLEAARRRGDSTSKPHIGGTKVPANFLIPHSFFPELGRPNNNPKPPEQSALKILEEAGRRPHGFSASNIINAHIPDAKPAPTDFGTCGGTHQFTTPE